MSDPARDLARRTAAWATLTLSALAAVGCAAPAERVERLAQRLGLEHRVVTGTDFRHVIYEKPGRAHRALHVYIGGDGSPWIDERWVAADPTPRDPLTLRLIALDPGPSLYLGRPCYHGLTTDPACDPVLWTHRRYGEAVVASMVAALRRAVPECTGRGVVLIGYSGGGTLAMLMAERLPETRAVVTVAANLDVAAWAKLHGYTPLAGSLDPARRPPLPETIRQLHFAAARDEVVPPDLIRRGLRAQPGVQLEVIANADHDCCWTRRWPGILEQVRAAANR